jgi:hypothetical protein
MNKKIVFLAAFAFSFFVAKTQNLEYARNCVNELTSKKYHGRGYVKDGSNKAASFLFDEFLKFTNDKPIFQSFSFPVNTFPGKMKVAIDGIKLIPGKDYIIGTACPTINGEFAIYKIDKLNYENIAADLKNQFVLFDSTGSNGAIDKEFIKRFQLAYKPAGYIQIEEKKLTWSVNSVQKFPVVYILRSALPSTPNKIKLQVDAQLINYTAKNVIGEIAGKNADTCIFITAHYDHLGQMGKSTYFPGGNDNASGISMMLNLMQHFAKKENQPQYTLVFIGFAGEEAGLIGSEYYTNHPTKDLKKVKFLLNLDLMGTGDDGIMVVNGSVFEKEFLLMEKINSDLKLLTTVGKRGKAQNSDHYHFTEKGVPSFFLYTTGGRTAYHDIYDDGPGLPLTNFKEVFTLLSTFIKTIN